MKKASNRSNLTLVELEEGIFVRTPIPSENHSALRAGFAGYTANPRWCNSKVMAWRTGRAWRDALREKTLAIRQSDGLLVPFAEAQETPQPSKEKKTSLLTKLKRRTTSMHDTQQIQQA